MPIKFQKIVTNFSTGIKKFIQIRTSIPDMQARDVVKISEPTLVVLSRKSERMQLCELFINSSFSSMNDGSLVQKIIKKIMALPLKITATDKSSGNIWEAVKCENKIAGGYNLIVNAKDKSASINFLTLAPEFKKTKTGYKTLIKMAENICKNAEKQGAEYIKWITHKENSDAYRLFKKFPAQQQEGGFGQIEYIIPVNDFKQILIK